MLFSKHIVSCSGALDIGSELQLSGKGGHCTGKTTFLLSWRPPVLLTDVPWAATIYENSRGDR